MTSNNVSKRRNLVASRYAEGYREYFSVKIDSIIVVNSKNGEGFLVCELTHEKLTVSRQT